MRRINFKMKCHVSGIYNTLVKWFLIWVTLADMLRRNDGFVGVHGAHRIGKSNVEGQRLPKFCNEKELCGANK